MLTSIKEYKKQLNILHPEQKLKHIHNTMNELKQLYYPYTLNIIDMSNILRNLEELCVIRWSIEELDTTPIDSCVKLLINIANKCDNLNESNQSLMKNMLKYPHKKSTHMKNCLIILNF